MLQFYAKEKKCIDLGRRGEDSARVILFDISGWAELYGQGKAYLVAKRERDLESYSVPVTQTNTVVSWVVTPVDNDQPGYGNCELVYVTDGSVVKSVIYQTHTNVSLSDPVSPPSKPSTYGEVAKAVEELQSTVDELSKDVKDSVVVKTPAKVGQAVVVKAVDENGNPIEWETADVEGSGGTTPIGEVTPDKVIFPDGAYTTYEIGKVTLENGMGTLVEPNGTLADFFRNFVDERNPETVEPSVDIFFSQAKSYEVGTEITPTYSATLNPGSYTYGPDTEVTVESWEVTDTLGNESDSDSGSFDKFSVPDNEDYRIAVKVTHSDGAIPVTNTGKAYAEGQIKSGSKEVVSDAITGYRNSFYGTLPTKDTLTSDSIRGLSNKSNRALSNGSSFTITIPLGAKRVVFAYPDTLRDVTSVNDVNGLNANITSSFSKQVLNVEGANGYTPIGYKVYTLDFAKENDVENSFKVKI